MAQAPMAPGAPPAPAPDLQQKRQQFLQGKRADVQRQATAGLQQNQDAINRRFAAMGGSGSGAQIAANLKAQDQSAAQAQQGMAGVDAQELQMLEGDTQRAQQESQFGRTLGLQQGAQDLQRRGQDLQNEQFGKQYGLSSEQFIQDQYDNMFNLMGQYGLGDIGAAFTNRFGAGGISPGVLERRLGHLRANGSYDPEAVRREIEQAQRAWDQRKTGGR